MTSTMIGFPVCDNWTVNAYKHNFVSNLVLTGKVAVIRRSIAGMSGIENIGPLLSYSVFKLRSADITTKTDYMAQRRATHCVAH